MYIHEVKYAREQQELAKLQEKNSEISDQDTRNKNTTPPAIDDPSKSDKQGNNLETSPVDVSKEDENKNIMENLINPEDNKSVDPAKDLIPLPTPNDDSMS